MNRFAGEQNMVSTGVPRASGDEPEFEIEENARRMCSPRERG